MRIYIATSWKNQDRARHIAGVLRRAGHAVDCFCEEGQGRLVFNWARLSNINPAEATAPEVLTHPEVQKGFAEDKKWIDWAEVLMLILPAGRSSHLEAGYAKGQDKHLLILGPFPKGEFDCMYGFADKLCEDIDEVLSYVGETRLASG